MAPPRKKSKLTGVECETSPEVVQIDTTDESSGDATKCDTSSEKSAPSMPVLGSAASPFTQCVPELAQSPTEIVHSLTTPQVPMIIKLSSTSTTSKSSTLASSSKLIAPTTVVSMNPSTVPQIQSEAPLIKPNFAKTRVGSSKSATSKSPSKMVRPSPPEIRVSYFNDIRKIMHSFGDHRGPDVEAARLVEKITQRQMDLLITEAQEVALIRKATQIGLEDILFLMRNDLNKLARLVKYFQLKDARHLYPNHSADSLLGASNAADVKDLIDWEAYCEDYAGASTILPDAASLTGRVKRIYQCLKAINTPNGRLMDIFRQDFHPDAITEARNRRLDEFTQRMTLQEYLFFQNCRTVSFAGHHFTSSSALSSGRFVDWLIPKDRQPRLSLKLGSDAIEALQHLAYETVGTIVEMCLVIREEEDQKSVQDDERAPLGIPMIRERISEEKDEAKLENLKSTIPEMKQLAAKVLTDSAQSFQLTVGLPNPRPYHAPSHQLFYSPKISKEQILEALRRLEDKSTPISRFSRTFPANMSKRARLFCI